jgi:hypothetical protein
VGGISLGGVVSTLVASHADAWPTALQPDFAVPVAPSARVDDLPFDSSLTESLGVTDALQAAGWTRESMDDTCCALGTRLASTQSGGLRDEMTQYQPTRTVFEQWGVPEPNFTEWDYGHFGVLLRVMRTQEFQDLLRTLLDEPHQNTGIAV